MFTDKRVFVVTPLIASFLILAASLVAWAQEAETPPPATAPAATAPADTPEDPAIDVTDKSLKDLWEAYIHWVEMGRADLARSYGKALLAANPKEQDLFKLAAQKKATQETLVKKGLKLEGLKDITTEILKKIEGGYQADRTNPEMIATAIKNLGGDMQTYQNASNRLLASGEYAIPQLIGALESKDSSQSLKERIRTLLPKFERDGVNALSMALQSGDSTVQAAVASALGNIGYAHAAPFVKQLAARKDLPAESLKAAETALLKLVGKDDAAKSLAELAYRTAGDYYANKQSLLPDVRFSTANVWFWKEGLGLNYKPVPRDAFDEIYAQRLAKLALEAEPKMYPAMSLWLAANFRREAQLAGAADPTLPQDTPTARFFALASPPSILQEVLAIGLKDKNSPVITGAIEALARTQGAESMVAPAVKGGHQTLVEALSYDDANVRYLAALSLAGALPTKKFAGSDSVMYVLNEALRQKAPKTALLVADDDTSRTAMQEALRAGGFEVIATDTGKAVEAAKAAPAVDLILIAGEKPQAAVASIRKEDAFARTQIIVTDASAAELAKGDSRVAIMATGQKVSDVLAAAAGAPAAGSPLTDEQQAAWAVKAANAAYMLGLTNNQVFDVARLRPSLIQGLASADENLVVASAKALSMQSAPQAQQAVAELATKAGINEKLRIQALDVLTDSVRKAGNMLSEAQVQAIYALVTAQGSNELREAAAQAWGSLNLPSEKSKSLIVELSPRS